MASSMTEYYQARAHEFESVYDKPERQEDLHKLRDWLAGRRRAYRARGRLRHRLLDGGGGDHGKGHRRDGFQSGPVEIARAKGLGAHVRFEQADAFALPDYAMAFDAGMAHFWWSHVSLPTSSASSRISRRSCARARSC